MLLWHPRSTRPGVNLLIGLALLMADGAGLIIMLPSLINAPFGTMVIVVITYIAVVLIGMSIQLGFRTSFNLNELLKLLNRRGAISEYSVQDYLRVMGLSTLPVVERMGDTFSADYRVLRLPGYIGFASFQYAPRKSFVLAPCRPEQMTAGQLSKLLHEFGHIGLSNLLKATAHASYRIGPTIDESDLKSVIKASQYPLLSSFKDEMRNIRRRIIRWQNFETTISVAAVALFLTDFDPLTPTILYFFMSCAAAFRTGPSRLEAEIEADHYGVMSYVAMSTIRKYDRIFTSSNASKVLSFTQRNDNYMSKENNEFRNTVYKMMLDHAKKGLLQLSDFYLWYGSRAGAIPISAIRIVLALICAWIVGVRTLVVLPWLLVMYSCILSALALWAAWAWRRSFNRVNAEIAEKQMSMAL